MLTLTPLASAGIFENMYFDNTTPTTSLTRTNLVNLQPFTNSNLPPYFQNFRHSIFHPFVHIDLDQI